MRHVQIERDVDRWRAAARRLLNDNVPPSEVVWAETHEGLLPMEPPLAAGASPAAPSPSGTQPDAPHAPPASPRFTVPPAFAGLCERVAAHRDPSRWALLYRVLWRLTHGERHLLDVTVDDDVHELLTREQAVRRDRHKMTAFVRFRQIASTDGGSANDEKSIAQYVAQYIAWYEPAHYVLRLAAGHFIDRFAAMHWAILTPEESLVWDGQAALFGPGVPRRCAPAEDQYESLWKTYYANIFNPNRLSVRTMMSEMPRRYWHTMPETELIPSLVRGANQRATAMANSRKKSVHSQPSAKDAAEGAPSPASLDPTQGAAACEAEANVVAVSAAEFIPKSASLPQLRTASKTCKGCPLFCHATQTVFGEGPADASLVLVGEQPGDQEDLSGRPFVGPAGQLLDQVLEEVGIDRKQVYVTNTVKHFKWEPRGKRRIHATPNAREVAACLPWLQEELKVIKPKAVVCLGSTAAKALLGRGFQITKQHGQPQAADWSPWTLATYHPSALLRIPDPAARKATREIFTHDLQLVAQQISGHR